MWYIRDIQIVDNVGVHIRMYPVMCNALLPSVLSSLVSEFALNVPKKTHLVVIVLACFR